MSDTVLKTEKLTKDFGGLRAVNELDMEIKKGEIHALIGPNGSGKSTTLNLLSGIYLPTEGDICFKDEKINTLPVFQRTELGIGRTFQNIRLFDTLTVFDNILVGRHTKLSTNFFQQIMKTKALREEEEENREKILGLCKTVGLLGREHLLANGLPYGDRRMLEIARALAGNPSLLLLDEPFAGMSPTDADRLVEIIQEIGNAGTTILLVEHHMRVVMKLSHNISVLNFGVKIAGGTPEEIKNNQNVIEAYLGKEG
ncbi:MAG: ABC transporter ATP-binding protein [Oscillospiraceae bacterium]|nr:ABC transporter ATP-binding protein [Oscillospiraceae bacterium]